jgi:hypothetical protein
MRGAGRRGAAMNQRKDSDLGWVLLACLVAVVAGVLGMYAIVTLSPRHAPERFDYPRQSTLIVQLEATT